MTIIVPLGGNLSYLSPPNIVLGATLYNVPLVTNTGVPLSSKESLWCQIIEGLVLVSEEEAEEEGVRALKRRKRAIGLYLCSYGYVL